MYLFNLFDAQSGGISLLFIGFCEAAVIGWGVGECRSQKLLLILLSIMLYVTDQAIG